ncbi:MAG: N-6 DNA methylase, partial [Candidatus Odinarchaeota archaeon]
MNNIKKILDSQFISEIFGINSKVYFKALEYLKDQAEILKSYESKFKEWKNFFINIYGYEINSDLFFKHTYFIILLELLVYFKLSNHKNFNIKGDYEEYLTIDLRQLKILDFSYFSWIKFNKDLFIKINKIIRDMKFAKEELFSNIYQEIILPDIRHKIGEFYTPSTLVKKMIEDIYWMGLKILDPSCGSGRFLINL